MISEFAGSSDGGFLFFAVLRMQLKCLIGELRVAFLIEISILDTTGESNSVSRYQVTLPDVMPSSVVEINPLGLDGGD